jgi:hypothetical protein
MPRYYMSAVHGNLAQGVPLRPYDGLVSWHVVRHQVARVAAFMAGTLR